MRLGDITSTRLLIAKGVLFACLGVLAGVLIVMDSGGLWWHSLVLLIVCVWAFCRAYYFAFYVIKHYIDPTFNYAGLTSALKYLCKPNTRKHAHSISGQDSEIDNPCDNGGYANRVDHPLYGKRPRYTGLNPIEYFFSRYFNGNSPVEERIAGTAIKADITKQADATVHVTHYFDVKRICRDCDRPFIFFAQEQRYWYEELGLKLHADCVRCVPCRRQQRELSRCRKRYEELYRMKTRSEQEHLEMAECLLTIYEADDCSFKQPTRTKLRTLLNLTSSTYRKSERYQTIVERLGRLDS